MRACELWCSCGVYTRCVAGFACALWCYCRPIPGIHTQQTPPASNQRSPSNQSALQSAVSDMTGSPLGGRGVRAWKLQARRGQMIHRHHHFQTTLARRLVSLAAASGLDTPTLEVPVWACFSIDWRTNKAFWWALDLRGVQIDGFKSTDRPVIDRFHQILGLRRPPRPKAHIDQRGHNGLEFRALDRLGA